MAKKNSLDLQVLLSLPGFTKLEGTLVEVTPAGVLFDSRKPGGQNRIHEFVARENIIAVVGSEGKGESTLWKYDNTVIFGTKQRNSLTISNPVAYGEAHVKGSGPEHDVVIINAKVARLLNEIKSEEGGRGRKPGKAKTEKPAKAAKGKKGKKSEDWE